MSDRREYSVNAGAFSNDSFPPDDYDDSLLFSLLLEEINHDDDQITGITEGLNLQKTLLSSFMTTVVVMDSDQNSGDSLLIPDNHEDDQISVITEGLHLQKSLLPGDKMSAEEETEEVDIFSKICQLCVLQEKEIEMIRISRCGHYCCYKCLIEYVAGKFDDADNCWMKCPAGNCCYLMEYDYCVALMLQYTLDKKTDKLNIS